MQLCRLSQKDKDQMKTKLSAILGAAALLCMPALAEARGQGQAAMLPDFDMLDRNQSGQVTLEDFQAALTIAWAERRAAKTAGRTERGGSEDKMDRSATRLGHGPRNADRAATMSERLFARIDTNGDGVITAPEYAAFQANALQMKERRGKSDARPRGGMRAQ